MMRLKNEWWSSLLLNSNRIMFFCIGIFLTLSTVQAQNELNAYDDYVFPQYSFINYSENYIKTFSTKALQHVFTEMKALEEKDDRQVHIIHIGDSHIQADMFSGEMRRLFREDTRFSQCSRGFMFPYRLARTNNPYNYKTSYTGTWLGKRIPRSRDKSQWGLAGITAKTTSLNATVTLNPNSLGDFYESNKVKVFYPTEDKFSFKVNIRPEEGNYITSYLEGDGFVEFSLRRPQSSIQLSFQKDNFKQSHFLMQGVTLENNEPGIIYSASGVNGAEVKSYFRCESFIKNLVILKPDLVILSLGTNDAYMYQFNKETFKANYRYLIGQIKASIPHVSILLTTAGDNYRRRRYVNKNNEVVKDIMLDLAKEMDLAVWDFYTVMGGFKSIQQWYNNGLSQRDKLHFTFKGYRFQGRLFYEAFMKTYNSVMF